MSEEFHASPANIRELKCVVKDVIRSIGVIGVVANFHQVCNRCIMANADHIDG